MKKLSLVSIERAVAGLGRAVAAPRESLNPFEIELRRDAIIQRFEYTYELAWKFVRRAIKEAEGEATLDQLLTRQDLFRKAAELGLIDDPTRWFDYHEARNLTSHVYDEKVAKRVFESAVRFSEDVQQLLSVLQNRYGT